MKQVIFKENEISYDISEKNSENNQDDSSVKSKRNNEYKNKISLENEKVLINNENDNDNNITEIKNSNKILESFENEEDNSMNWVEGTL